MAARTLTVLSGGIGGARFLQGLLQACTARIGGLDVTVIANTADDLWLHGLKICPDLDTVMYTLGDGIDLDRGWGRRDETWSVKEELAAYGAEAPWFGLGDRDIATHLMRTRMLEAGYPLSAVTEALCRRWQPGVRLLPMTDDRVETHVAVPDADAPSGRRVVHFQEYWVRLHAEVPAEAVLVVGLEDAAPAPGVLEAIAEADVVIVPPSNPVVSVGTILGVPGHPRGPARHAGTRGRPLPHRRRRPRPGDGRAAADLASASRCPPPAWPGTTAPARPTGCWTAGWWTRVDADLVASVTEAGIACRAVPLMMTDHDATAAMALAALDLVS